MRKNTIRLIVEVSILAALGLVFDLLCGAFLSFAWLNGGSISIACLPILIAAYKYDFKGGLLCGLLVGSIQLIWAKSSYLIHPVQVMLDYVIPYLLVGAVGALTALANKTTESKTLKIIYIVTGIIIGFALKTLSQTLSGVWYWATPLQNHLYIMVHITLLAVYVVLFLLYHYHLMKLLCVDLMKKKLNK